MIIYIYIYVCKLMTHDILITSGICINNITPIGYNTIMYAAQCTIPDLE